MEEFDHNEFPLAYLITVRCYGTWLTLTVGFPPCDIVSFPKRLC